MKDFIHNILIGLMFLIGLLGFISGELVISSILFAFSTIAISRHLKRTVQESAGQPVATVYSGLKSVASYHAVFNLHPISWPGTMDNSVNQTMTAKQL